MKKIRKMFSFTLTLLLLFSSVSPESLAQTKEDSPSPASETEIEGTYKEGTVLVTLAAPKRTALTKEGKASFDPEISIEETYDFGSADALACTKAQENFLSDKTWYVSEVSSDTYSTKELIGELNDQAYVMSVEPDYEQYLSTVSNDPYAKEQWHLDGGSNLGGSSTGISYSYTRSKAKSGEPVIAVMDTGIDSTHEDLADHMWTNTDITIPGVHGYNFTDSTPNCEDDNGHGTHCAGTIAAVSDNGKGITGISNARLMSLKVFDNTGTTNNSIILRSLNYIIQAKSAGVNIVAVNCSWGGGTSGSSMPSLVKQIGELGTLFVFASGNDGVSHDSGIENTCPYDLFSGSYSGNRNYMIITGSSNISDTPSQFSDYGKNTVDLFAPGENILSSCHEEIYLPGVCTDAVETGQTAIYNTLDTQEDAGNIYTSNDLNCATSIAAAISYDTSMDYHSSSNSGSLKWSLNLGSPQWKNKSTYLYLDVTDLDPNPDANYYVSMFLGSENDDGSFTWDHVVKKSTGSYGDDSNRFYITPDGHIYFKIIGLEMSGNNTGKVQYYIDNIGISTANPDPSLFGKYEVMSGTSMAAPMVTGAVSLLSEIYPEDSVQNRKKRLLTCVRKNSSLTEKCITGGILDLSYMDAYTPVPDEPAATESTQINSSDTSAAGGSGSTAETTAKKIKVTKIRIKASKKKLKAGKKLTLKAIITPSSATTKKVTWHSSAKKWASISKKGVLTAKKKGIGHTVKITAKATDGSGKKASIKIRITK